VLLQVIKTNEYLLRIDGSFIKFKEYGCIVVDNNLSPVGSKISSIVPIEVRVLSTKCASMAKKYI
jgi:ribosomal protein L14